MSEPFKLLLVIRRFENYSYGTNKIFIECISLQFTEELREHFGQYGDIESINVKTDPQTGRSRGFAFIVYTSPDAIEKVTADPEHVINNKKVDPKKAKARHGKIFVGGLTSEISDDEIKIFFGQFGNVSFVSVTRFNSSIPEDNQILFIIKFDFTF